MKVRISADDCIGCGLCPDSCPDIFEMDGDKAVVKTADVPGDKEACVKEAAEACPTEAIIVE
ncbi:MAG: ferredoxin [Candidatus Eisenbacteria bacterium]|nr:ferredoxin [Candidatus Eisenbacteria bacterium]